MVAAEYVLIGTAALNADQPARAGLLATAAAVAIGVRRLSESLGLAWIRRDLIVAFAHAVLRSRVSMTLPSALESLDACERVLGGSIPVTFGAGAAILVLLPSVATRLDGAHVIAAVAGMTLGGACLLASPYARRISNASFDAYDHLCVQLNGLLLGRDEIVSNGATNKLVANIDSVSHAWAARARWSQGVGGVLRRAPVVVGALGTLAILLAAQGAIHVQTLAPLGALVWAAIALVSAVVEGGQQRGRVQTLITVFTPMPATLKGQETLVHAKDFSLLTARALQFEYGTNGSLWARPVNFSLRKPNFIVVTGANGCGKSTLLRLLAGLLEPTAGAWTVEVQLGDAKPRHAVDLRLAYMPQRPYMDLEGSVLDALRFPGRDMAVSVATRVLSQVPIWGVLVHRAPEAPLNVRVSELSAGQKQWLAIARVLAEDVPLVLLDEPEANIDNAGIDALTEVLGALRSRSCVVAAVHDPRLIALADQVIALDGSSPNDLDARAVR